MKTMRKIFALLLALTMVFAMAITASAADDGTITINAATPGKTYKLYKIFDATYSDSNVAYTYTKSIDDVVVEGQNPIIKDQLFMALMSDDSPFTLTETSDGTYNVGLKKETLGSDIGVFLKSIEDKMGNPVDTRTPADGITTVSFTGLDYGYYYIAKGADPLPGPTVGVTVVTPSQTINDKSTNPGEIDPHTDPTDPNNPGDYKILVDSDGMYIGSSENTANYGDTVYFVLQAKATNYDDGKKVVEYTAYDVLGEGFENFQVTKVTVDGTEITLGTDYNVVTSGSPITVTIPWVKNDAENTHKYASDGTALIKIYCQAVVGENAVIGEENSNTTNKGWFNWEYDNGTDGPNTPDPHDPTKPESGDTVTKTVTTKVYAIAIHKTDAKGKGLAGANFEIHDENGDKVPVTEDPAGSGTYKYDKNSTNFTVVSPASGTIIVKGLERKTYSVIETVAPNGYNKMEVAKSVTATEFSSSTTELTLYYDENGNLTSEDKKNTENKVTFDVASAAINVINVAGTTLPSTGGMGTTLFYILGGILVAAAVILMVTKKRMGYEA